MTTTPELWTIDEVTTYIGASSTGSARKTLSRWGIKAAAYGRSDNGRPMSLYPADEIRAAKAARPGRGARTDLGAA